MNDWKRLEAEQRVERVTPIRALLRRRRGACVVCGGPFPDGSGCEFCPAVDEQVVECHVDESAGQREGVIDEPKV